jgi:hypothetical protein
VDGLLFEGVLDANDPGFVVWMAGKLHAAFSAKVSAASAVLHFSYGRKTYPGAVITLLLTNELTDAFSNTGYSLIEKHSTLAESVGAAISDMFYLKVWATTTSGTPIKVTFGTGLNCRSSINVPVPCRSLTGYESG